MTYRRKRVSEDLKCEMQCRDDSHAELRGASKRQCIPPLPAERQCSIQRVNSSHIGCILYEVYATLTPSGKSQCLRCGKSWISKRIKVRSRLHNKTLTRMAEVPEIPRSSSTESNNAVRPIPHCRAHRVWTTISGRQPCISEGKLRMLDDPANSASGLLIV